LTRVLTVVEQAEVKAGEWERDREAWNLPRRSVGTDPHASRELANETTESEPLEAWEESGAELTAFGTIKKLPKDVSVLDREGLRRARATRDERLSVLFRRWPALTTIELDEIRRLHDERQRLARYVGMLRQRQRAESRGT
jgi:hypothetical protein